MKKLLIGAVAVFTVTVAQSVSHSEPRMLIYGIDDRIDLYQDTSDKYRHLADSVVSLWNSSGGDRARIVIEGKTAKLRTHKYGSITFPNNNSMYPNYLHKDERFYTQPAGSFCSGSLVGPDLIMTAGHCVRNESRPLAPACADIKFVFGFAVEKKGRYPQSVPASEVYSCARVAAHGESLIYGDDFALIKLDRAVTGHTPLKINRGDSIAPGTEIFTIGHPRGLPLKIATYGKVRKIYENGPGILGGFFFVTDLDTWKGNSGSPVFNAKTGLVEGMVVRGPKVEYVKKDGDYRSRVVGQDEGSGSSSINISVMAGLIPVLNDDMQAHSHTSKDISVPPEPIPAERAQATAVTIDMSGIMPDQSRLDQIRDMLASQ